MRPSMLAALTAAVVISYPAPSVWTFTYSTIAAGYSATQAALSDGVQTDVGANTFKTLTSDTSNHLTADLGGLSMVTSAIVGNITGVAATQINAALVQISSDGTAWTTISTLAGFTTAATTQSIAIGSVCRYVRLYRSPSSYRLSVGEFKFT